MSVFSSEACSPRITCVRLSFKWSNTMCVCTCVYTRGHLSPMQVHVQCLLRHPPGMPREHLPQGGRDLNGTMDRAL